MTDTPIEKPKHENGRSLRLRAPRLTEEQTLEFTNRGVPGSAFSLPYGYNLFSQVGNIEANKKRPTISAARQMLIFKRTIDDPLSSIYSYAVTGKHHPRYPRAATLHVFNKAIQLAKRNNLAPPLWHMILGTLRDKLRDNEGVFRVNRPCLLVIDGLAANSVRTKFEIARDLLEIYHDVPRIVIAAGCDPYQLFFDLLYQPLNRVLFFADRISFSHTPSTAR